MDFPVRRIENNGIEGMRRVDFLNVARVADVDRHADGQAVFLDILPRQRAQARLQLQAAPARLYKTRGQHERENPVAAAQIQIDALRPAGHEVRQDERIQIEPVTRLALADFQTAAENFIECLFLDHDPPPAFTRPPPPEAAGNTIRLFP